MVIGVGLGFGAEAVHRVPHVIVEDGQRVRSSGASGRRVRTGSEEALDRRIGRGRPCAAPATVRNAGPSRPPPGEHMPLPRVAVLADRDLPPTSTRSPGSAESRAGPGVRQGSSRDVGPAASPGTARSTDVDQGSVPHLRMADAAGVTHHRSAPGMGRGRAAGSAAARKRAVLIGKTTTAQARRRRALRRPYLRPSLHPRDHRRGVTKGPSSRSGSAAPAGWARSAIRLHDTPENSAAATGSPSIVDPSSTWR
jgi:hypothetical protein